jgi:hypothetical protein
VSRSIFFVGYTPHIFSLNQKSFQVNQSELNCLIGVAIAVAFPELQNWNRLLDMHCLEFSRRNFTQNVETPVRVILSPLPIAFRQNETRPE